MNRRGVRSAVRDCDADQDVIGTAFGVLHEDIEVAVILEDSGVLEFEFPVERAVFATVLHRLMVSGSDRACEKWMTDYAIPNADELALHHLYRAMAWLGEELPEDQQAGATPFTPRTVKDCIEEHLFAARRDGARSPGRLARR